MIQKFCPDGVECKILGEIANIVTGSKPPDILEIETEYEYINAGTTNSGYVTSANCDGDTVTTPARGQGGIGFIGYQHKPFWLGPLCYKVKSINESRVLTKYLYYCLQNNQANLLKMKKEGGTPAINKVDLVRMQVFIPPLPIQSEIVKILDNFTELTARKKQYDYYRNKLLSFEEANGVIRRTLGEIADAFRGEYITKKSARAGNIPVILGGQEPAYYIDKSNHDGEIVVIARSGASAGFVSYWNEPIFITDGFGYEAKKGTAIPKFLYYMLKNMEAELNAMKRGAGVPHVSGEALGQVLLPIPPLEEQKRIITILDHFNTLCNDLTSGLPAEIAARQKQYEYYRDKLLIFKELNT